MQDIKVQSHDRQNETLVVDFRYYAIGEKDPDEEDYGARIEGSGIARINDQAAIELQALTASVSHS